jgi:hypothetical protein
MKKYFYSLLARQVGLHVLKGDPVWEVNPRSVLLANALQGLGVDKYSKVDEISELPAQEGRSFILLNGNVHHSPDIQRLLTGAAAASNAETRVMVLFYSSLWRPFTRLATFLGWRRAEPEENWVAPEDMHNLAQLTGLEVISHKQRVLMPLYVPLLSTLMNRLIVHLPLFRSLCMVNLMMLRKVEVQIDTQLSVSIVVAARNEEGHIESIVKRLPALGPDDELIFVEGGSSDGTWAEIQRVQAAYADSLTILMAQQDGKGKGDAVRKGFDMATKDILMILDADITVSPEDLPKFYDAICSNRGEFINGSRLVYPMEDQAMRFFNILGNKFFALAFSYVLGQRLKDTLCGTKVLTRENYLRIAANRSYFGDFDPFGDFDLLFGASRLGLKITEMPIRYASRTYGETNISRWSHGVLLLRMLIFAARKIRFI